MGSEISVRILQDKVNAILNHIREDLKVERVAIAPEQDFYWNLPDDDIFDINRGPPEIANGRLSDDLDFLSKMDDRDAVALMLIHIAPLLKYIAHKVPQ